MTVDRTTNNKRFRVMVQSTMSQAHTTPLSAVNKPLRAGLAHQQSVHTQADLLKSLFPVKDRPMFADEDLANLPMPQAHSGLKPIEVDTYSSSPSFTSAASPVELPTVWSELGQRVQRWWSHLLVPTDETMSPDLLPDLSPDLSKPSKLRNSKSRNYSTQSAVVQSTKLKQRPAAFIRPVQILSDTSVTRPTSTTLRHSSTLKQTELDAFMSRQEVMTQVVKEHQQEEGTQHKALVGQAALNRLSDTPTSQRIEDQRTQRLLARNQFLSTSINHLVDGYFHRQGQ